MHVVPGYAWNHAVALLAVALHAIPAAIFQRACAFLYAYTGSEFRMCQTREERTEGSRTMNIQWSNMTGFGPGAWNHGGQALEIPSMVHHHEQHATLVLHSHEGIVSHSHHLHRFGPHVPHKARRSAEC